MLKRAYIEITKICNLSCSFCPGTRRPPRTMTPEEFRRLAEKLRGHVGYLYFHVMGEPLLHPQLEELLGIAGELGFRVCLTTNGTLLERRGAARLGPPAPHQGTLSPPPKGGHGAGGHLRPAAVEHRRGGPAKRRDIGFFRGQAWRPSPVPAPAQIGQLAVGGAALPGAGGEVRLAGPGRA